MKTLYNNFKIHLQNQAFKLKMVKSRLRDKGTWKKNSFDNNEKKIFSRQIKNNFK